MRIFTHKNVDNWDKHLTYVEMYLNSTPTTTSSISPYKAVFGQDMALPLEIAVADLVPEVKHTIEHMQ